ncbi:MAG: beta-propeller fold lactonase family protein [Xanthomonadales bacterium]|nr:beta-propeller fold lactonase family protein [Xanthomonadales bacterium]
MILKSLTMATLLSLGTAWSQQIDSFTVTFDPNTADDLGNTPNIIAEFDMTDSSGASDRSVDMTLTLSGGLGFTGGATTNPGVGALIGNSSGSTTLTWDNIDLDAGMDGTYTLTVPVTIVGSGPLEATGTLSGANNVTVNDSSGFANFDTADLSLSLTRVGSGGVTVGDDVTFRVGVNNARSTGNDVTRSAGSVNVTVNVPSGYSFRSDSGNECSVADNTGTDGTLLVDFGTVSSSVLEDNCLVVLRALASPASYQVTAAVSDSTTPDFDSIPTNAYGLGEDDEATLTVTPTAADLVVSISPDDTSPEVGDCVVFTTSVQNLGPDDADNVDIDITVPSGFSVSNCAAGSAGISFDNQDIANGSTANFRTEAVLTAGNGGADTTEFQVTAAITDSDTGLINTGNDSATAAITNFADLSLSLVPDTLTPVVGGTETIDVNVSNNGNRNAPQVAVCIDIPTGLTVTDSGAASTSASECGGDLFWNVGTLGATGSDSLTITATIDPTGSYVVSAEIVDPNPAGGIAPDSDSVAENGSTTEDDDDSFTYNPVEVADLSLNLSVSDPLPDIGESPTFTLALNNGPLSDEPGPIVVTYTVPNGYNYVSSTPASGSINDSGDPVIVWTVSGGLNSGQSTAMTLVAEVIAGSDYRHTAEVTSAGAPDADSTPGNGVESEDDFAAITAAPTAAELVVTQETAPDPGVSGSQYTYSFRIANNAAVNATGVLVSDVYPTFDGMSLPSAGFSGDVSWQCEAFDGACCNSNSANCGTTPNPTSPLTTALTGVPMDLAPLSSVIITVSGDLDPRSSGTLANSVTASVAPGSFEQDTSDNTNINTLTGVGVNQEADLSITKISTGTTGTGPFTIAYEVRVSNGGPSFAGGALVTDLFDESDPVDGAFFDPSTVVWSCATDGGTALSICPASGTGALNGVPVSLEPGASAVFMISVETLVTSGSVTNSASVAAPAGVTDNIGSNNTATERVVLTGASDLEISQQGPAMDVVAGTDLTYTVQIVNNGPDFAPAASVTDVLPSQVVNVTWECSAVTPVPGDLTLVEAETRAADMQQPGGFAYSPSGEHVYVASQATDSLLVFSRVTIPSFDFGEISFLEVEVNGVDDGGDFGPAVADMDLPLNVAVSPDGRYVYVTAVNSGAIAWFQRDTLTASADYGRLTFAGSISDPSLAGAVDLVISDDGEHVYATASSAVVWLTRDTGNGNLSMPTAYPHAAATGGAVSLASAVRLSPSGEFVLVSAVNTESENTVRVLSRQTDSGAVDFGALTHLDYYDGVSGSGLRITPNGNFVYVARPAANLITRYSLQADGTLTNPSDITAVTAGLGADALDNVTSLDISPDGEHLAAGALTSDRVNYLRINAVTGDLLPQDGSQLVDGAGGNNLIADPTFLVFSPDARHLLVSSQADNAISVYDRRAPDPILTFIEFEKDGQAGEIGQPVVTGMIGPAAVVVSPDGDHVYAASVDGNGSVAAFSRNAAAGITVDTRGQNLRFIESYTGGTGGVEGLNGVADLTFDPTGTYLYAASEGDNAVALFQRDSMTGTLSFVEAVFDGFGGFDGLSGAAALAVDPDGKFLYVAARFEAAVGVFAIGGDGRLSFVEKISNSDAGVSGLEGASAVVVAPDSGAEPGHVMVTSAVDNSLVVFARDRVSGMLSFQEVYGSGVGERPLDLEVSPSGKHVYTAAANTSSVSVFSRNDDETDPDFGSLQFRAVYIDGLDGVDTLGGARAISISPDGKRAYVVAETDQALNVFSVNSESSSSTFGELTFIEARIDNQEGVEGLDQTYDVAVSGDSRNVYAVGLDDNAVAAFRLGEGSRCPAGGSGNLSGVSVDIAPAGVLTFFISGTAKSSATTGNLTNTATVAVPDGFEDPVESSMDGNAESESATVVTALAAESDVFITKTDNRISNIAGETTSYTLTIGNLGPSDAIHAAPGNVRVSDILDGSDTPGDISDDDRFVLAETSWACTAIGSGSLSLIEVEQDIDGLLGVTSAAVAPAFGTVQAHLYATSVLDDSLMVFEIDPNTGGLTFQQRVRNGDTVGSMQVTGLAGARDVVVTEDGQFIYVVSQLGDAISVFQASDNAGAVSLALIQELGTSTIPEMDQPVSVLLAGSEEQVYVAASKADAVVLFNRNTSSGLLSFQASYVNGGQGISGLQGPVDLAIAGNQLYAAATNSSSVVVFDRNPGTGQLSFDSVLADDATLLLAAPSAVSASSDDRFLFVASSGENAVTSFERDSMSGALTPVDSIQQGVGDISQLSGPSDLVVSGDDFHVYVAAAGSGAINIISLGSDGELVLNGVISDIGDSGGLGGVSGLALNGDSRFLYSLAEIDNSVAAFERIADSSCPVSGSGNIDAVPVNIAAGGQIVFTLDTRVAANVTGTLRNNATIAADVDGDGVQCGDLDDPGDDNNNCATDVNDLNPEADLVITKSDQFIEFDGLAGADAVIASADGEFLYVAGNGEQSIAIFRRNTVAPGGLDDPILGEPVFDSFVRNGIDGVSGLNGVTDLAISGDGQNLYAVASLDSAVTVFDRDPVSGELSISQDLRNDGTISGLSGASAIALSADDRHVYVSGRNTGTLAVFARDEMDGTLTFLQGIQNGLDGVVSMAQPVDLAVSAGGDQLYVVSALDNSLLVFDRDADEQSGMFGQLMSRQVLTTGIDGVTNLLSPAAVAVEPGDRHIYVAAADSAALVVLERDGVSGDVSFAGAIDEAGAGLSLSGVSQLAFNDALPADFLYASATDSDSVAVFQRDDATGLLTGVGEIRQGDATVVPTQTVRGLTRAAGLVISPGGDDLYVASPAAGSITQFSRNAASGELTYLLNRADGGGGAAPGSVVTYVIEVNNTGPSNVDVARVTDLFPDQFSDISWTCAPTDISGPVTASCQASGDGSLDGEPVILPVGTGVRFTALATLRADATGRVVNTASVTAETALDPNPINNTAVDDDTVLAPAVDLVATNSNGVSALNPGQSVTYTFGVTNNGPSNAAQVLVEHILPERLSFSTWSCEALPVPGRLSALADPAPMGMTDVTDIVISSDGTHVYAVGRDGPSGAIAFYRRDNRDGSVQAAGLPISNGTNLDGDIVNGLSGAERLALSPDGLHLYVASAGDDAVAIFQRDAADGELSFVGRVLDGVAGVNGLGGALDVVIAGGGSDVYVAGGADNAIARFSRNAADGTLTFEDTVSSAQIAGLDSPSRLILGPGENFLYVLSQANDRITRLERDPSGVLANAVVLENSQLTEPALVAPADLVFSADGLSAFVAATGSDSVARFSVDDTSGVLTLQQAIFDGDPGVDALNGPVGLALSSGGLELYVASADSPSVTLFTLLNGELVQRQSVQAGLPTDLAGIVLAPGERQAYLAADDIDGFDVNAGSRCVPGGNGNISDVAQVSAGGQLTYTLDARVSTAAVGTVDSTVQATALGNVMELNPLSNAATDSDSVTPQTGGVDVTMVRRNVGRPDGNPVAGVGVEYDISLVNNSSADALLASLEILLPFYPDDANGVDEASVQLPVCQFVEPLTLNQSFSDTGLGGVSDSLISGDSNFVYALGANGGNLLAYRRAGGSLVLEDTITDGAMSGGLMVSGLAGAEGLALAADGTQLYVAATASNQLLVFNRDTGDGSLALFQVLSNGQDNVTSLTGPVDIAVAPGGGQVYVAAPAADSIVQFNRDSSGVLTFDERVRDGFGTIAPDSNVIRGVSALSISGTGDSLVAAGTGSDRLVSFRINPVDGNLEYRGANDAAATPTLTAPRDVIISRSGIAVYAITASEVFAFAHDSTTGEFSLIEVESSGAGSNPAFGGLAAFVLTTDGSKMIVASTATRELLLFHRDFASGSLRFGGLVGEASAGPTLDDVSALAVSPDDRELLVAHPTQGQASWWDFLGFSVCPDTALGGADALTQLVDIAAGSRLDLTVAATVNPRSRGRLTSSTRLVSGAAVVGQAALDGVSDDILVEHDLVAEVLSVTDSPVAGQTIDLSLGFSNAGPSAAVSGEINLDLTAGVSSISYSCTPATGASCAASGSGPVSGFALELDPAGSVQLDVTGSLDPSLVGPLAVSGSIAVEAGASDPLPANNSLVFTPLPEVVQVSDLSAVFMQLGSPWNQGTSVSYEVLVRNDGPSDSLGNALSGVVPDAIQPVTISCSSFTSPICPTDGTGFDATVDLPAGSEAVLVIEGDLPLLTRAGSVTASGGITPPAAVTDPDAANNDYSAMPDIQRRADLSVSLVDNRDPYDPDGNGPGITYLATIVNTGPSAADVGVRYTLPDGFTAVEPPTNCFLDLTVQSPPSVFECRLADLLPGSGEVSLRLRPDASLPDGTYQVPGELVSDAIDAGTADNFATEETTLARGIDVAASQTPNVNNLVPGDSFVIDILVSNQGSAPVLEVEVTGQMDPALVTGLSWTCEADAQSVCDAASGTGQLNLTGGLSARQSLAITLSGTLDAAVDVDLVDSIDSTVTATVMDAAGDLFVPNNTDITTILVDDVVFSNGFEEPDTP